MIISLKKGRKNDIKRKEEEGHCAISGGKGEKWKSVQLFSMSKQITAE